VPLKQLYKRAIPAPETAMKLRRCCYAMRVSSDPTTLACTLGQPYRVMVSHSDMEKKSACSSTPSQGTQNIHLCSTICVANSPRLAPLGTKKGVPSHRESARTV